MEIDNLKIKAEEIIKRKRKVNDKITKKVLPEKEILPIKIGFSLDHIDVVIKEQIRQRIDEIEVGEQKVKIIKEYDEKIGKLINRTDNKYTGLYNKLSDKIKYEIEIINSKFGKSKDIIDNLSKNKTNEIKLHGEELNLKLQKLKKEYERSDQKLDKIKSNFIAIKKQIESHTINSHIDTKATGEELNRLTQAYEGDYADDLHRHNPEGIFKKTEEMIINAISNVNSNNAVRIDVRDEKDSPKVEGVDTFTFSEHTVTKQGGGRVKIINTHIHVGDTAPSDVWEGRLWVDTA
jgi:hypothetical protein